MPKVTSTSVDSATSNPSLRSFRNCATGSMAWSDGSTAITASGPSCEMSAAASATAGAVFLPSGSGMMRAGASPLSSRAACLASASEVTASTRLGPTTTLTLSQVSASKVCGPSSGRNCLGCASRLKGQRRSPLPPANSTAYRMVLPSALARDVSVDGLRLVHDPVPGEPVDHVGPAFFLVLADDLG